MKIAKPLTLGILHKPYRFDGRDRLAIAALGFFRLGAENERFLPESLQWPLVVPMLAAGQPLDEVMPKRYGEALLLGSAHAPGGKPRSGMCVRMCIGGIDKRLHIAGEREWNQATEPRPFTAMPLVHERAYGGPGHAGNPVGCGYAGKFKRNAGAIPNISYPDASLQSPWRSMPPAGFGPLNVGWAPRKDKFGTYGSRWLKHEAPGFASDIDWTVFNLAPPDQWINGYFQGGEAYRLEGLHPDKPVIEGRLPTLRARAFVLRKGAPAEAATEAPLRLDTVWFLPEHELGIAIYHGEADIGDSDALDVAAVMVGYEDIAQPKPAAHYLEVLALRLNPQTAALHAFDESQLAATRSPATETRRKIALAKLEAAELEKQQAVMDEMDAEFWEKNGIVPPPGHRPRQAEPPPFGVVNSQAVAEGDFDLAKTIELAKAMARKVELEGAAKLQALRKTMPPAPALDPRAELAAAMERAAVPAYDLLPPLETGRDPQLGAMLSELEREYLAGRFADQAAYERARQAVLQGPALRRQLRRGAPTPTVAALPLSLDNAQELGRHAIAWHRSGICLAGRDLAGADLRGADFSGADLREIMLEGADLSNARFIGANLQGAVLTGAVLTGADFSRAQLGGANLSASQGERVRFTCADLSKAQAISAAWPRADLDGANLDGMLGVKINLQGATLQDAHAHGTILLEAVADGSVWRRASLDKTVALRANLQDADFSDARLNKTVVIEAALQRSVWNNAVLSGVQGTGKTDWSGATFTGARADNCGMHGAVFAGADFSGSSFLRCDFGECDLCDARMNDGLFSYSLFMQADLRRAVARRADFFQAICRKADLRDAILDGAAFAQTEMTAALLGASASACAPCEPAGRAA
jgi:uncharacterized protein YjbI with pentapeptide repeats